MRDLFPGHYRPRPEEFKRLWDEALFVFDTNVLLNLYSYPHKTREEVFSLLDKISQRSWIPYQVALEFHRNRFSRVKSSNKAVHQVRDRVSEAYRLLEMELKRIEFEKRGTGIENIDERMLAVREANEKMVEALEAVCANLPGTGLGDPIAERIADLFENRVGMPPSDQQALDKMVGDAEDRIAAKIPPGFKDAKKAEQYVDRGLSYSAKYGDLILWRQTISHVHSTSVKAVIFVTGDRKEDWWDEADGEIRGPQPDLIIEFLRESGAECFWMYSVEAFLEHAREQLDVKEITADTIAQVKETAAQERREFWTADTAFDRKTLSAWLTSRMLDFDAPRDMDWNKTISALITKQMQEQSEAWIRDCVVNWMKQTHPGSTVESHVLVDICLAEGARKHGYEIIKHQDLFAATVVDRIKELAALVASGNLDSISIVSVVTESPPGSTEIHTITSSINRIYRTLGVKSIIFGTIIDNSFSAFNVMFLHGD